MARLRLARASGRLGSGATAVEFALIFPVFLTIVLGIIEVGNAMWVQNSLSYAVQEATRFAIVRGGAGGATTGQIRERAMDRLHNIDSDRATVTVDFLPDNNPGSVVDVQITYDHDPLTGFVGLGPFELTARSRMVIGW